jgi:hypothetical protein
VSVSGWGSEGGRTKEKKKKRKKLVVRKKCESNLEARQ